MTVQRVLWKMGKGWGALHIASEVPGIALCGTEALWEVDYQEPECKVCLELEAKR